MMNTIWKKAASLGLCAGLAVSALSGCSLGDDFKESAAVITVNDETVSAGVLKFAVHYLQSQYESYFSSMGYAGVINQDVFGTGSTLGESIKDEIVSEMEHLILAEQHMEEYGVSLSEEQKKAASDAAAAFLEANDKDVLEKMAATQENVERYLVLVAEQELMEEAMGADVDTEVSDEEAAQRRIRYTLFSPETETEEETEASSEEETSDSEEFLMESEMPEETSVPEEETAALEENKTEKSKSADETEAESAEDETWDFGEDETWEDETWGEESTEEETETETEDPAMAAAKAEARAKAEELIAKIQDGEDFETASAEVDPDAYCGTMTFGQGDADYRAELLEATDGLADGTLVETPVETSSGYYVVLLETQLDREATDSEKEYIVEQRRSDQVEALYTEWEEAGEISTDSEVLDTITFEFSLTRETDAPDAQDGAETEGIQEEGTEAFSEDSEWDFEDETGDFWETETDGLEEAETE